MYYSDAKLVSKSEYKMFVDQSVEVYRLKEKVSELENVKISLKTKIASLGTSLNKKSNELKELKRLVNMYKKEQKESSRKQTDYDTHGLKVRNLQILI